MTTSDGRRDLPSLTGLRAIAALLVFGTHTTYAADHFAPWKVLFVGYVGVALFFILSGMVLAWGTSAGTGPRRFWWRRFARIYPLHLVTTVAALGFLVLVGSEAVRLAPTVAALGLVQAWVPVHGWFDAGNHVSWSLSCEATFYAAFPVLMAAFRRHSVRWQASLVAVVLVVCSAVSVAGSMLGGGRYDLAVYSHPAVRFGEFALGCVLGLRLAQGWRPGLSLRHGWAAAVVTFVVVQVVRHALPGSDHRGLMDVLVIPGFAVLLLALALADLRGDRSWLAVRPVVYAGEVSFAFYLVHAMAIDAWFHLVGYDGLTTATAGFLLATQLATAAALAVAAHHLVERPARVWLLDLSPSRRAAQEPAESGHSSAATVP